MKAYVRAHKRRAKDGRVVQVGSYHNSVIPGLHVSPADDDRTGDLFEQKDEALEAAINHLTADAHQRDIPSDEKKEDTALVERLKRAKIADSRPVLILRS